MNFTAHILSIATQFNSTMANNRTNTVFPIKPWLLSCYVIIASAGIVGNILVLIVLFSNKHILRSSIGVYLGGLAIADLSVAISGVPVYLLSTSDFKRHPTGILGTVMCKLVTGYNIMFYFAVVSVYTLLAMSWDRYTVICKPTSDAPVATPARAKKVIAAIWIWSLIIRINALVGEEYTEPRDAQVGAHCKFSISYHDKIIPKLIYGLIFTVQYIVPLSIMIFCFAKIRQELIKHNDRLLSHEDGKKLDPAVQHLLQLRTKTVNIIICVIIAYFVLWTPNQFLYLCYNFNLLHTQWNSKPVQASLIIYFVTCCINPVIYAARSQIFRHGFLATFKCANRNRSVREREYTTLSNDPGEVNV